MHQQLPLLDHKYSVLGAENHDFGTWNRKNETQVGFRIPGGSKISLNRCVSRDLVDFEVILGSQNEPESVQNRCQKVVKKWSSFRSIFGAPQSSPGSQNVDFTLKKSIDRWGQHFQKKLTPGSEKWCFWSSKVVQNRARKHQISGLKFDWISEWSKSRILDGATIWVRPHGPEIGSRGWHYQRN